MQKIIIVGEKSYIGNHFEAFSRDTFTVKKVNSRDNTWKSAGFSGFDCVLYCAGIAHRKDAERSLYFAVNCDLAVEIAEKAKNEGVRQFMYLSSAAVLSDPSGFYGQSKLKAENALKKLQNNQFSMTIVRPPMVYGQDCKGNFQRLLKLAEICPVFPKINNKRSMIYIENLCYFLVWTIENQKSGTYFPQNADFVNTTQFFKLIRENLNKKTCLTKIFNPFIRLFSKYISTLDKLFGDFIYTGTDCENIDYINFEESVKKSVYKKK